ncbi:MAG: hypothetical protein Q8K61_03605 [Gallionella sp.]|nr:hypothetical protein [Gallionella sp.]
MKLLRFLNSRAWLLLSISMLCSTHALSQQVIGVDENGQIRVTRESPSRETGNQALFEALAEGRKQGTIARSATSGRNPTPDEISIIVGGRLLSLIEDDAQSLQRELGVSNEVLNFAKEALITARDHEQQMIALRLEKMCSQWRQNSLASGDKLAGTLEHYNSLATSDSEEISKKYIESISSIEAKFGSEVYDPINSMVLDLWESTERSSYFPWGSLVMSQANPEATIEFHCQGGSNE